MANAPNIAVVGATGVVGREVLGALLERDHPAEHLTVLASERSEGGEVEFGEETIPLEKAEPEAFRGMNAVILATPPEISRTLATQAQQAGAWVVDTSPAFRGDPEIPLVVPELNRELLGRPFKGRIVATPSPLTTALATILAPLARSFGVEQAIATGLLGASSLGNPGVAELETQTADLLSGRDPEAARFPHRLGFNVIPHVGAAEGTARWTADELSLSTEVARVLGEVKAPVAATLVQVPTFYGHALSLSIRLGRGVNEDEVREVLKAAPMVKVLDALGEKIYPMPMLVTADPSVHVGRLRLVPDHPSWILAFATIDNAGRGAALNAVEAAFELLSRPS